jgi:hypothetical protein
MTSRELTRQIWIKINGSMPINVKSSAFLNLNMRVRTAVSSNPNCHKTLEKDPIDKRANKWEYRDVAVADPQDATPSQMEPVHFSAQPMDEPMDVDEYVEPPAQIIYIIGPTFYVHIFGENTIRAVNMQELMEQYPILLSKINV